jgi:uncharacterized protein YkwD
MNLVKVLILSVVCLSEAFAAGAGNPDSPKRYSSFTPEPTEVVAAHNFVRGKVGVPPLSWSDDLARVAQRWADKLMDSGVFMHSTDMRFGENLFQISGLGASSTPYEVVNAWGSESDFYRYDTNTCHGECGHYTQVVWRDTKQVGCAVSRNDNREIWVCEYAPYGNIVGERPY